MRPGRASQLMLEEVTWRIGLFQNHPEVLPRLVPFATPPFYSNSDDQTIFNDAISGVDTDVVSQPCRAYWVRVPASCVPCVPEAQGSLARTLYVRRTRTSLGRAVHTAHRGTTGHHLREPRQPQLPRQYRAHGGAQPPQRTARPRVGHAARGKAAPAANPAGNPPAPQLEGAEVAVVVGRSRP